MPAPAVLNMSRAPVHHLPVLNPQEEGILEWPVQECCLPGEHLALDMQGLLDLADRRLGPALYDV